MNQADRRKKWREDKLKQRYGLSPSDYQLRLLLQGNKCGICGTPFNDSYRPNVDHRHSDNHVRGLLCEACNSMFGWYEKYRYYILAWELR